MMPFLLFFLIIIILGGSSYLYFRKEQGKTLTPKDKYDESWDEFYDKKQSDESVFSEEFALFRKTYGIALVVTLVVISVKFAVFENSVFSFLPVFPFLLIFGPFFFPAGLAMFFDPNGDNSSLLFSLIGWISYIAIFYLSILLVKNRKAFYYIYLTFIMLLILNIFGCAQSIGTDLLSGLN